MSIEHPTWLRTVLDSTLDSQEQVWLILAMTLIASALIALRLRKRSTKKSRSQQKHEDQSALQTAPETPPPTRTIHDSPQKKSVTEQIRAGLTKTRLSLWAGLEELISGKVKIDSDSLEQLHEVLYKSDVGVQTTDKIIDSLRFALDKGAKNPSWSEISSAIARKTEEILSKANSTPFSIDSEGPCVFLIVGVNGVGKTTTIGKLAAHFKNSGKSVILAAADTYRAAAIEQLSVWGERLDLRVVAHKAHSDPAAVAYDGVKAALASNTDVLLIDTAGRLHNKDHLMKELAKIRKVIAKDLPEAPQHTFLVLDATVGQNAFAQVEAFREILTLTGLVITKLDGTAKGGVVVGLADRYGLPIRFIGVGEKQDDLKPFVAKDFADSLVT